MSLNLQGPAMDFKELKDILDQKVDEYNRLAFIENDPICIPHAFDLPQDIEIAGFLAATLAWGQRVTIINKCLELLQLMDNSPHQFVLHHSENDLKCLLKFKHRTFNTTDLLYFVQFFHHHYSAHDSLEEAFSSAITSQDETVEKGLIHFNNSFFSLPDFPPRTRKHIATPERKSACKRINMYLRWMVRHDDRGVDFGLWKAIRPAQLVCPCDLHVDRVARSFGLITRKQTDWQTALELTHNLRKMDPQDPVKYDFALFGMGVMDLR